MISQAEVWMYGSRARGDADSLSDTDLLVVGDPEFDATSLVPAWVGKDVNLSRYSWSEIEAMRSYGSLFLHHLAAEGQCLAAVPAWSAHLSALLKDMPPFMRAQDDIRGFRAAVTESYESLRGGGWPDFECEVVATVARHAAILGSYCIGEPSFGREEPFWVVGRALGYSADRICALVGPATAWRKHTRACDESDFAVEDWVTRVAQFVNDLEVIVDRYERVILRAVA